MAGLVPAIPSEVASHRRHGRDHRVKPGDDAEMSQRLGSRNKMADHIPEEAKNFKLLGHDSSRGLGRRHHRRNQQGLRLCRRGRRRELQRPGRLHRPRRARPPQAARRSPRSSAPPGVHSHKLRVVDGDFLYVNSERLVGDAGRNARTGLFIFDISKGGEPKQVGFYDTARHRPAPLRRRQQAQARVPAERRAGLEQARDLDARHQAIRSSPRWSASGACRG